ncbi:unnamed protein product [Ostreobium quekettii]|uniref:Uncharacterized protein n=1 Tax=Ostreobium quekettii TaxID=121088 RepID=A0A8S1J6U6_9CHLO|nr:unnamed protein product [Ostreobium quekettii]|eukprot:evm.model.scf_64.20 EVM.evm.TU.scf_64.20   scf_64:164425-169289(-)
MQDVDLLQQCRSLSSRVKAFVKRTVAEADGLAEDVRSLQRSIDTTEQAAQESGDGLVQEQMAAARQVLRGNGPGGDLRKLCHKTNPKLLRFLLGKSTKVLTLRPEESLALKEEYHSFRDMASYVMILWPAVLLYGMNRAAQKMVGNEPYSLAPTVMAGVQVFLVWLAYVYTAAALRENILVVNGSNIRGWWITHHYLSLVTCIIMLTIPVDSQAWTMFCPKFLRWTVFQAVVMMVQNWYQRRRMYTRIALGKDSAMDVVTGETSGAEGQLWLLYPMLVVLQMWQMVIGGEMVLRTAPAMQSLEGWLDMEAHESDLRGQRGIFLTGSLFALMGLLNFGHTVATFVQKSCRRRRPKKTEQGSKAKQSKLQ